MAAWLYDVRTLLLGFAQRQVYIVLALARAMHARNMTLTTYQCKMADNEEGKKATALSWPLYTQ
jgi:hypothetical protein